MDAQIFSKVEVKNTLFYLDICHLETINHTAFHSFCLFAFENKIENFHSFHIKGGNKV